MHSFFFFFFSSRRRHTRFDCDWSSDVCSSDLRLARRHVALNEWLGRADLDEPIGDAVVHAQAGDVVRAEPALTQLGRDVLGPEVVSGEPAIQGPEQPTTDPPVGPAVGGALDAAR